MARRISPLKTKSNKPDHGGDKTPVGLLTGQHKTTPDTNPIVAEHAEAIRSLGKRVVADVIEIGRRLAECKKLLGHGNWLPWLDREFGWSEDTALNFMRVGGLAKSRNFRDLNLPVSSLYLLAAPSTPAEVRDEIIERAESGEKVPHSQVVERVRRAKPKSTRKSKPAEPALDPAETVAMAEQVKKELARIREQPKADVLPFASADDVRTKHIVINGEPRHGRGSGTTTTSAAEVSVRLLIDLLAQGVKADPAKVARLLHKKLKAEQIAKLFSWLGKVFVAPDLSEGVAS